MVAEFSIPLIKHLFYFVYYYYYYYFKWVIA